MELDLSVILSFVKWKIPCKNLSLVISISLIFMISICIRDTEGAILASDRNNLRSQLTKADLPLNSPSGTGCGGVLHNQNGVISYKPNENYDINERCVWTIVNTYYTNVMLELTSEGFGDPGDYVELYYRKYSEHELSSPEPVSVPRCDGHLLTHAGSFCNLASSLIFVVFKSNANMAKGTGFTLSVERTGTFYIPRDRYYSSTLTVEKGWVNHRESLGYAPYKWLTWTISPNLKMTTISVDDDDDDAGKAIAVTPASLAVSNTDSTSTSTSSEKVAQDKAIIPLPSKLTIFKFNITTPPSTSPCVSGSTPLLTIYQTLPGGVADARVIRRICGSLRQPVTISYPSVEPYIILYENGAGRYDYEGEDDKNIQMYWNMDQPPEDWNEQPPKDPCEPDFAVRGCQANVLDIVLLTVLIVIFRQGVLQV